MKNILTFVIVLTLFSCSMMDSDEKNQSVIKLEKIVEEGMGELKNRTNNFSIYDRPYLTVSKDSVKSKYLKLPVNIYSVSMLNLNEVLEFIESQFNIPSYISDYYALGDEDTADLNESRKVNYEGNLSGFMAYLGKLYGVKIGIDDTNLIRVSVYETKTYSLNQFIDGNKSTASLTVGGGEGSGGGLKDRKSVV